MLPRDATIFSVLFKGKDSPTKIKLINKLSPNGLAFYRRVMQKKEAEKVYSMSSYVDLLSNEIFELTAPVRRGSSGAIVKRVQEWLGLHGHAVAIDGQYGPATEAAVKAFQAVPLVAAPTWRAMIEPITQAAQLMGLQDMTLGEAVVLYAQRHLAQRPREVGGQNKGPWVRLYMGGHEGTEWAWCAGFVCFVYQQAAADLHQTIPFRPTYSCDDLAAQAKALSRFLQGPVSEPVARVKPGSIFLVRKSNTDWIHTGIVVAAFPEYCTTIEGNTNDDGSREGYEVCTRRRAYKNLDFFLV